MTVGTNTHARTCARTHAHELRVAAAKNSHKKVTIGECWYKHDQSCVEAAVWSAASFLITVMTGNEICFQWVLSPLAAAPSSGDPGLPEDCRAEKNIY